MKKNLVLLSTLRASKNLTEKLKILIKKANNNYEVVSSDDTREPKNKVICNINFNDHESERNGVKVEELLEICINKLGEMNEIKKSEDIYKCINKLVEGLDILDKNKES